MMCGIKATEGQRKNYERCRLMRLIESGYVNTMDKKRKRKFEKRKCRKYEIEKVGMVIKRERIT